MYRTKGSAKKTTVLIRKVAVSPKLSRLEYERGQNSRRVPSIQGKAVLSDGVVNHKTAMAAVANTNRTDPLQHR